MLKYQLFENFVNSNKNLSHEKKIYIYSFSNNNFIYDSSCKSFFREI